MSIKLAVSNTSDIDDISRIGANNLTTVSGAFFMKVTSGIADKATAATDRIVGVNYSQAVYASDNVTVAQSPVLIDNKERGNTYDVTITGGTITVSDEGKFYNISDAETVDGTTEATVPYYVDTTVGEAVDPVISMQLELVKYISATKGEFRIINL